MANYTKQTPAEVREWLASLQLAFPEDWSLNQVVDECRRRYLSDRGGLQDIRLVIHWAAKKLSAERTFTACHWEWIGGASPMPNLGFYSRLGQVLEPAFPHGPGWKATESDRAALLVEIGNKARDLLRVLETERRIDVSLSEVVGLRPEMRPLFDRATEITEKRMRQVQAWSIAMRDGNESEIPPAEHPNFASPYLSDYLQALLAKLLGKGRRAFPKFRVPGDPEDAEEPADDEDGDELDDAFLGSLLYGSSGQPLDPGLLRAGGDFGKYPARADSLLSTVIKAFPQAIYDRISEPPQCTPASLIEAACMAWFGESPSQSEINKRTKEQRQELVAAMRRNINAIKKSNAIRVKLEAEGKLPSEIRARLFGSFLDDE